MKVTISTSSFAQYDPRPLQLLEKAALKVTLNPYCRTVGTEELIGLAKDSQGLIAGTENLSGEILQQLKFLKVISRCGAGTDNIDLKVSEGLGIKVFTTPDGPTQAVAELTVGLILDLLRKISFLNKNPPGSIGEAA